PNCAATPRPCAPTGTSASTPRPILRAQRSASASTYRTKSQIFRKSLAGGPGFEPRLTGSEPVVLPLNYPPRGPAEAARCSGANGAWQAAVAVRFGGAWPVDAASRRAPSSVTIGSRKETAMAGEQTPRTGPKGGWHSGRFAHTFAAIDLGTNNCRLLVARASVDGFDVIDAFSRPVRLGEGVALNGALCGDAIERT